jgi:pimeloyl-ACP methyl ester carboxylesterase
LLLTLLVAGASCKKKEGASSETVEASNETKEGTETKTTGTMDAAASTTGAMPAPTAAVKVSGKDELDVWVVGEGTPVVLVHGAFFYSLLKPLAEELAEKGYQAIWYHRRGYNGKPTGPADVPEQARDIVKILDELEISKAHVVGHSAGGLYALALAMEAPDRLSSVVLCDPMLATQVKSGKMVVEQTEPIMAKLQGGDVEGAATAFIAPMGATKELMEQTLPGSWSIMIKDAPTWFQVEIPAFMKWKADPAKVKAIEVPLAWLGNTPFPPIRETAELLKQWQPKLKVLEISDAGHFIPVTATAEMATVLDSWISSQGS